MGGLELFLLVVAVDVVCGPLLTMVIYKTTKPRLELVRDLSCVAIIQLTALLYGLYIVMAVRPVYLVYEVDRFNAISAMDVDETELINVKSPWNVLPVWEVLVIATREPKDDDERLKSISASLMGREPSTRPDWWQPFNNTSRRDALHRARKLADLRSIHNKNPGAMKKIDIAIGDARKTEDSLRWLPLTSKRDTDWVVLVDSHTAEPLAYAAVSGFSL